MRFKYFNFLPFFFLALLSFLLISCLSNNEDNYALNTPNDYIPIISEDVTDICLQQYDSLGEENRVLICQNPECVSHFSICMPTLPKPTENTNDLCQDGLDNDKDSLIDCLDPSCENVAACLPEGENTPEKCTDAIDNDNDSLIDCQDIDCSHLTVCLQSEENTIDLCSDLQDNDGDQFIDCEDPDCAQIVACLPDSENTALLCSDSLDNDKDSLIDCEDPECQIMEHCLDIPEIPDEFEDTNLECSDNLDNDNDSLIDCDDPGCADVKHCLPVIPDISENTNALCQDKKDNDEDGLIDCDDPECANVVFCLPEGENTKDKCSDNIDNDGDNLIDCEDLDCAHIDHCLDPEENTVAFCQDEMDNDGDKLIDCEDPDCALIVSCLPDSENTFLLCDDNIDNDGDGAIDCDDSECEIMEHCLDVIPNIENSNVRCSDGEDNDNDGLTDCDDDTCKDVLACLPNITITPINSSANNATLQSAADNSTAGVVWNRGINREDQQINEPDLYIKDGTWGGIYMATGLTGRTRRTIDLSKYFFNKLKFGAKTDCSESDFDFKVQWKSGDPDDQDGLAYNYTAKVRDLIPKDSNWNVGDNEWHDYEINFAEAVRMDIDNARELVIPFSLWCIGNGENKSIVAQNIRFEGSGDIDCITISGAAGFENQIYCDVQDLDELP